MQIIHPLLRDGRVDFAGTFYAASACELRPRGPRPQGPPIMIGTTGKQMIDLAARYADFWNVWLEEIGNTVDNLVPLLAAVDAACEANGRDPKTLERTAAVLVE